MIRYQITDGALISMTADYVQIRPASLAAVRRAMALRGNILVNDRTDIALALGAAGVHLRSNSIAPPVLRRITPRRFIITVACHSMEDVMRAEGADFALLAPVFRPLSKTHTLPPLGLDALRQISLASPVPVIALGGVTPANAPDCIAAGAAGVAGITMFTG